MRIGIIGGAFDPITISHLRLAREIIEQDLLDEVWYLPCYISYYDKKMASPEHRLKMCQLAVASLNQPRIKVCDYEIAHQSTGNSETIWAEMMQVYNADDQHDFYFIIGMDNANKIHIWGNFDVLVNTIAFLIIPRVGSPAEPDAWYFKPPHLVMKFEPDEVSSTEVRQQVRNGQESKLVVPEIMSYLQEHQLYQSPPS